MNKIQKNLDKQKEREYIKTVEEWLIHNRNKDFNLSQHCEIYSIKDKEKKDIYKYFELMRSIIDEEMKNKEKDNYINKIEEFEKIKYSFRVQKIFYRIYDQKKNLWVEPTYYQIAKKKSKGFFTKIKTAMITFVKDILSSEDTIEYTTLDEAVEHRKECIDLIRYGNDLVRYGVERLDSTDRYIEIMSKTENKKLLKSQKQLKKDIVIIPPKNIKEGELSTSEEINTVNSKSVICPDCKSNNVKELLQTSNGNRMKCLDCGEIFVSVV